PRARRPRARPSGRPGLRAGRRPTARSRRPGVAHRRARRHDRTARPARPVPRRRAGRSLTVTTNVTAEVTGADSPEALRTRIADLLTAARARSAALTDAVDDADLVAQHSPLMSPLVWDLAHIGSQEELWLVRDVGGRP